MSNSFSMVRDTSLIEDFECEKREDFEDEEYCPREDSSTKIYKPMESITYGKNIKIIFIL